MDNRDFTNLLGKELEKALLQEKLLAEKEELADIFLSALNSRIKPFPDREMTPEAKAERLRRSRNDFFYWDKTYFPPDVIPNYAAPGAFHKSLIALTELRDAKAHILAGPRSHAKTSYFKRRLIHIMLFGLRKYIGFGSGTLRAPKQFILDVLAFLRTNKRIQNDFNIHYLQSSVEALHIMTDVSDSNTGTFLEPLSEERSTRGGQKNLTDRYDLIVFTDIENETVSLTKEGVEKRIDRINEMRGSLESWGTLICEGNNFSPDTAINKLVEEEENGKLSENIMLHIYPAWDGSRPGKSRSLWYAKYPANSEEELKAMLKPRNAYDWAGNYQQKPKMRGSDIFPEEFYHEWEVLPRDCRFILYTDPNLSKKGEGDTTASGAMGYSPQMMGFYIPEIICKSYSTPDELLTDMLSTRSRLHANHYYVRSMGFDGNVSQESHWTEHVKAFAKIKGIPVPPIEYKRYNVDALIKTAETIYKSGKVFFPPGFSKTENGKSFLTQFFKFVGKKAAKKDDGPDWFCSAIEMLFETSLVSYNKPFDVNEIHSISKRELAERL